MIRGVDEPLDRCAGDAGLGLLADAPLPSIKGAKQRQLWIVPAHHAELKALAKERGVTVQRLLGIAIENLLSSQVDREKHVTRYDQFASEKTIERACAKDYFPWEVFRPGHRKKGSVARFFGAYRDRMTTYRALTAVCLEHGIGYNTFLRWAKKWQAFLQTGSPEGVKVTKLKLGGKR